MNLCSSAMESALNGSLKFQFPQRILSSPRHRGSGGSLTITCGLRSVSRKPLWRSKRLSTEAIQAIQALKLAKSSPSRLQQVFKTKLSRLLKTDLVDTLEILQKQNELELALKVFDFVREEEWYKPDISLYHGMIQLLGKNKRIEMVEELFTSLQKDEGLKPDTRAFSEMIGAYLHAGMIDKAMESYGRMKASGCDPDKFTFTILIRKLEGAGKVELAATIKEECGEYMDYPEKFLREIKEKYVN